MWFLHLFLLVYLIHRAAVLLGRDDCGGRGEKHPILPECVGNFNYLCRTTGLVRKKGENRAVLVLSVLCFGWNFKTHGGGGGVCGFWGTIW